MKKMTRATVLKLARAKWGRRAFARVAGEEKVVGIILGQIDGRSDWIERQRAAGSTWEEVAQRAGLIAEEGR